MSQYKTWQERLAEIQNEFAKTTTRTDAEIVELWKHFAKPWSDYIGESLEEGAVVSKYEVKYKVMNKIDKVLEIQPPDGDGMLALYKPYRDDGLYEWLYGEYVEVGWQRVWNDVIYTAIQDPNANIYNPDLVPAVWEAESESVSMEDIYEEVLGS